jgi:peptide/nickel transport system substrate-binding protein
MRLAPSNKKEEEQGEINMKTKIGWLIVGCLVVVALVLAACAQATPTTAPTTAPATTKPPMTAPPTTTAPAAAEPSYGGMLLVLGPYGVTPYAWDPADCDWYQAYLCGPVYENLMMGDIYKGPRGTNGFAFNHPEWIPDEFLTGDLAESWELVPPNKIVWHMRKGVQWTGKTGVMAAREFTAQDAEQALKRYMVSPKSSVGRFNWVNSLTATDKYTLVLEYNAFSADWSYLLGWGWATDIEPPETIKAGASDWRNIVGTGPFILADYVTGSSVTYTKNPNYWGNTKIGGKEYKTPFVDKMIYLIIADESTRLAALRTAKVDISMSSSWKFKETLEKTNPELLRWHQLGMGDFLVSMRVDRKPFDDRRVRLALSMAIDRQTVAKNPYYEPTDKPILNHYPMGANYPESVYTPIEKLPASAQEQFTYDPEKAKKLLADAGYPTGFKTEMILDATTTDPGDLSAMLKGMWQKIGVDVELKPMEYSAFQSMFLSKTQNAMVFYSKGLVHPLTVLRYNLPGQPWGPSNWNDPQYEKDYLAAKVITDDVERSKRLKELNVRAIDAVAYIGMPANYYYIYAYPWVKNYFGETNLGYINDASQAYAAIWLDQEAKNKGTGR